MQRKATENYSQKQELRTIVTDIFVVNQHKYRPYIELFHYAPTNITEQKFGTLLGFFHVRDYSDDSAYVVNFLTSVIKKEYFSKMQRSPAESFEAALQKVNIALAELAKHDNVSWLGKIDAAACALVGNTVHFSVSGDARFLLLRKNILSDISDGLASEEATENPMKTFLDVASGQMEDGDKIIATTPELFTLFSLAELSRNAQRFSSNDFSQFITTALTNELTLAGTIVVDVTKTTPPVMQERKPLPVTATANAFSSTSFTKATRKEKQSKKDPSEENASDYIDQRTGHIYIHENTENPQERGQTVSPTMFSAREHASDIVRDVRASMTHGLIVIKESSIHFLKRVGPFSSQTFSRMWQRVSPIGRLLIATIQSRAIKARERFRSRSPRQILSQTSFSKTDHHPTMSDLSQPPFLTRLLPRMSKMRVLFERLSYQQRLYAFLAIGAIVLLPFLGVLITHRNEAPEVPSIENLENIVVEQEQKALPQETLYKTQSLRGVTRVGDTVFAIAEKQIISFSENSVAQEFPLQDRYGTIRQFAPMDDLQLLFLLTDTGALLSFSPTTKTFTENSYSLPDDVSVGALGTYLTYLYVADKAHGQIYRLPRATGGFGERSAWLTQEQDLTALSTMMIDENIHLLRDGMITRFFRGAQQDFSLNATGTISQFFTNDTTAHIYVINTDGILLKLGKDGAEVTRYSDTTFTNAQSFIINETQNAAYVATTDGTLLKIDLRQ